MGEEMATCSSCYGKYDRAVRQSCPACGSSSVVLKEARVPDEVSADFESLGVLGFSRSGSAEFSYPQEVVFRAVQQAIDFVKGASIDRVDAEQGVIEVKVGMSAWSWGENVSLSVVSAGPRSAQVQITSSAKAAFNVSAIGKNEKNFQAIVRATAEVLDRNGEAWTKGNEVSSVDSDPNRGTSSPLLVADEIKKLADLRTAGILTDEEFAQQKARLLGS